MEREVWLAQIVTASDNKPVMTKVVATQMASYMRVKALGRLATAFVTGYLVA